MCTVSEQLIQTRRKSCLPVIDCGTGNYEYSNQKSKPFIFKIKGSTQKLKVPLFHRGGTNLLIFWVEYSKFVVEHLLRSKTAPDTIEEVSESPAHKIDMELA